uniref:Si:ch211-229d2.5 n=1 Tax=Erpetoichthys calabaricus TaxID=27687 RepID=A0A8C4S5N3_ERPCA
VLPVCVRVTVASKWFTDYNDIAVSCGAYSIELAVQVCPVVYSGYNETLLVMNNLITDPNCKGKLDMTTNPPVLRFNFSLNESGISIVQGLAQGPLLLSVNISGVIQSTDPNTGVVTYNQQLLYLYSCTYPLEYIINNTRIDVTGATIALKDNNGTFVTTLSLQLFSVSMTCHMGTNDIILPTTFNFDNLFFVFFLNRCTKQELVNIYVNGKSQYARFSFPAFRFTEQRNLTTSTYYLHCITRLCDTNDCANLQKVFLYMCGAGVNSGSSIIRSNINGSRNRSES